MKEFLMLIRGGQEKYIIASPNEMQKHLEHWQEWMGGLTKEERLLGGQPLIKEGNTLLERGKKVIDRPFAEGKELVGGYLLIKADSLDQATTIAKGCPSFEYDCSVEIREIAPLAQ
ncbi:YciI family protein [uncultured Aquimarina sp.]|uniref:YciI family protein n=1 Tax=uncultured Aquimarina sp. TaxID=575652 RepID=UPI00262FD42F|nr:YciI family protein [uncultured Aquimarina sp.]